MSPSRDHGRGTFPLDIQVKGIGRIRRASGTTDVDTLNDIKAMFRLLRRMGRWDILRAVSDGIVSPMDVWDRYRTGKLDKLPTAETMRRLWSTPTQPGVVDEWLDGIATTHRKKSAHNTFQALAKLERAPTASVAELPALLDRYRKVCERAGNAQMFRNARNNVRALLRDTVGKSHALYQAVATSTGLPITRGQGNPFSVTALVAFLADVEAKHGAPTVAIARSLACSGMRPVEYWGEWTHAEPTVLRIKTAKQRRGTVKYRLVPAPLPITPPTMARRTFEDRMRNVTRDRVAYDLRRTFMHLMEQARIPRSRRMSYLGHAAGDVSARYEEHEVTEYLAGDVERLQTLLAPLLKNQPTDKSPDNCEPS